MLNTQLHKPILRHQKAVQFNVNFLFHRAGRKEQISNNGANNTDHNLAAALEGKLRCQQGLSLDSNDDNQRRITRKPPGIGVLDLHQRRDPGTKTGPDTAHEDHQQRRTDHADDNYQCRNTADKRPDNTQHPTIADRTRIRFSTRRKSGACCHNRCGQHRPARGLKLKMKANEQRQHNGACQF